MNIQEALQSGLMFKRPNDNLWYEEVSAGKLCVKTLSGTMERYISDDDLLANDWLIKEERVKISLTKSEFLEIWENAMQCAASKARSQNEEMSIILTSLLNGLGFK